MSQKVKRKKRSRKRNVVSDQYKELLLKQILKIAQPRLVYSANITQYKLAKKLEIPQGTLSSYLSQLRDDGYIRTGRNFIDVTEEGVKFVKGYSSIAILLIKTDLKYRSKVYEEIMKYRAYTLELAPGESFDIAMFVVGVDINKLVSEISNIEGVRDIKVYRGSEGYKGISL